MRNIILAVLLFILSGCTSYDKLSDLSYDTTSVPYGVFDVYKPVLNSITPRPAIIYIHGGALLLGTKSEGKKFAEDLCPKGFVVFSIDYRLAGDTIAQDGSTIPGSRWPQSIDDCQKAIKFIKDNAHFYKINPNKIAIVGTSAGGMLAVTSILKPYNGEFLGNIAVNLDGWHDPRMPKNQVMSGYDPIMKAAFGHDEPWTNAELTSISSVVHARSGVKVLTIHGEKDDNVFVNQAYALNTALVAVGSENPMVILKNDDCHSDCWKKYPAYGTFINFLNSNLR